VECEEDAALVVDAGKAIADELLGNVGQPIAVALEPLLRGKGRPPADLVDLVTRTVGHAAVQFTVRVAVKSSARRIRRVLVDAGEIEGVAVVVRRMAAAMP